MTQMRPERARRGTDAASAWVRSLRLRLIRADDAGAERVINTGIPAKDVKHLLLTIAQYVDHEGRCFPSFQTLADDTEMSWDSIKRRIADAEYLGIVAKFRSWRDERGQINHEGRGRETSGQIRLLFDITQDEIDLRLAARVDGRDRPAAPGADDTDIAAPSEELGCAASPPSDDKLGYAPVPTRGTQSGAPLMNPSLEPKIPPNPPTGGSGIEDEAKEARWQQFRSSAYPDGIVDMEAARREFAALGEGDQIDAIAGVPAYADRCRRRREKSMKAHLYLRKRVWVGLIANPETRHVGASPYPPNSPAGQALLTLGSVARHSLFRLSGGVVFIGEVTPQLLALANAPPESEWQTYERGTNHFGAWWELISKTFAGRALSELTELRAPWPFPPRKDGTVGATSPPIGDNMTQDDIDVIANSN